MSPPQPSKRMDRPKVTPRSLTSKALTPETDGLELCKNAVALLVGDMRSEIQQARV